jgi:hypothetical protein
MSQQYVGTLKEVVKVTSEFLLMSACRWVIELLKSVVDWHTIIFKGRWFLYVTNAGMGYVARMADVIYAYLGIFLWENPKKRDLLADVGRMGG